ncbi:exonuclease SbcCD subunit D [Microterricola pindariensis]|uniref:Nuclease SbcCD subunit D n=1 Tax=Microterricola pindariensis TaxID=478010 RepID=A0ABX5ATG2_9MICO|nr:exonuclease SbcCD subunit D [Microterricola pindariensis]PPL14690.1 exonuclease sbcCD subunit D [Microterricola pindariensis]
MRILHTSDWHVGRTFHGHSTLAALDHVLAALAVEVRQRDIDVVVVAGDVFDSAVPSRDSYELLTRALGAIRAAGATVILTSGNHDSATRLGFQSEFASFGGVHVIARPEQHDRPVTLADEHGPVHFYGIPYLEPALVRGRYPEAELRTHAQTLGFAMDRVRADLAERGGRSVAISHCFAVNVGPADDTSEVPFADDVVRDITAGGLDLVPLRTFDGPDYVALGHIHGRSTLSERARYSGAPVHYSFSEAGKQRGGWLVELGPDGLEAVEWLPLPVPRALSVLTGTLEELLTDAVHTPAEGDWVRAILTDQSRPLDAMRKLQQRYRWCADLSHRPSVVAAASEASYAERVKAKSDAEIVAGFLEHVRNGDGASDAEREILAEVIATNEAARSGELAGELAGASTGGAA